MKKLDTNLFRDKARKVHGNRYDYSDVNYANYDTPITIGCSVHGIFLQTPRIHLLGKSNCQLCALEESSKNKSLSQSEFIRRAKSTHGSKYDYTECQYINHQTKAKIKCNQCNHFFFMRPSIHIYGQGCPTCGKDISGVRLTQLEFIKRLQERYGNVFLYDKIQYVNLATPVTVTCKQHGDFEQRGDYLLNNKIACPQCVLSSKVDKTNRLGSYNKSNVDHTPNKPALFYVVKFKDANETFFKVGITVQKKLKYRFSRMCVKGYKVEPVLTEQTTLQKAFELEQGLLRQYQDNHYVPMRKFDGYTECLSINPLKIN